MTYSAKLSSPDTTRRSPNQTKHHAAPWLFRTAMPAGIHRMAMQLWSYPTHGLQDLNNAGLMRRFDTKYILPLKTLPTLLHALTGSYSALTIDDRNIFAYASTYLDTPQLDFYRMHHNGRGHRHKVRRRSYLDTGTHYFEIKSKDNKSQTCKKRIQIHTGSGSNALAKAFVINVLGRQWLPLRPSLTCRYSRIAMADTCKRERLTLDFNLVFEHPVLKRTGTLPHLVIAELKQPRRNSQSPFATLMRRWRCRPLSFSKYCIGCCLIHGDRVRTNRFKSTCIQLKKPAFA